MLHRTFALLSEQMSAVAKRFGPIPARGIYEMKCPMAFDNRGARWLQDHKDVRNPYFGAAMLQCGEVIDVLPTQAEPRSGKPEGTQP